ncbi:uncharacterized protein LY79DRAFT_585368 [Colletotrichum navitas]|uniref:Uncharacterized protein n=1 Tax=Colletotrichum navitas TaxID=681940 RepID=A0AAD8UX20_9PEZI|nr:uncharacterized protein LY79DRAFT_585368 [Colletotrichum navitas]KAK1564010.1 hypothetical protein LY79DRAFT_585368 [Colletotrichum navitas]
MIKKLKTCRCSMDDSFLSHVAAPALEAVELVDRTFEGDFSQASPWRGHPSPERDAAWDYLTHDGGVNVPLENLHALNKSPEVDWERSDPAFGGGAVGLLEVFHQLHCLPK